MNNRKIVNTLAILILIAVALCSITSHAEGLDNMDLNSDEKKVLCLIKNNDFGTIEDKDLREQLIKIRQLRKLIERNKTGCVDAEEKRLSGGEK